MSKEYITKTNKTEEEGIDFSGDLKKIEFFGVGGEPQDSETKECYAKLQTYTNHKGQPRYSYYVKSGRDGSLFNPWGMYTEGTESKSFGSENYWRFQHVNKKCFDFYLRFLESRNNSWILHAEREIK